MRSILLVDDEEITSAELQRTLQRFGFRVEVAHTIETASALTRETRFDLILLEFNLRSERGTHPITGKGLQLLSQLRRSHLTAPALVFTVMEGDLYETASLDGGADDFVLKTAPIPCLIARLRA